MAEPKLRFPEFKGEWKEHMLNDYGTEISRVNEESDAPIMMISAGNGFIYQADRYKKDNAGTSLKKYIELHKEEFAYNHGYSKAKIYGSVFMLTEEQKARVPFVYHCFSIENGYKPFFAILLNRTQLNREIVRYISSTARQDGLLNISFEDFMKIKLFVPTIDEQRKITEIISSVDNVIASIESEVALWEEKKKGVMQKIFSQEVRFRKEDGTDYSEWEERTFADVFESLEYGMNTAATDYDGVNKYIRITDIDDDSRRYLINNVVSPSGKLNDKYIVNENDILFARTGASTGKSYLYRQEDGKLYFAGFLIRGHVKSEYNPFFIFVLTLTEQYDKWVSVMSTRSGQAGINATEYALFKFMSPCFEEQCKIGKLISAIDEVIETKKEKLATWKNIKKGLLQQMFV